MNITALKASVMIAIGAVGGFFSNLFGGFDATLITLLIFMAIDYISGITLALVFKKSPKSKTGALESNAGWKGLFRKGITLLVVLVANRLDIILSSSFIRDAVIIAFAANEAISIVENAGLMGIPIPSVVKEAIDVLRNKNSKSKSECKNDSQKETKE